MKSPSQEYCNWKKQQFSVQLIIHSKSSPLQLENDYSATIYNTLTHLYTQSEDLIYSFYLFDATTSNIALIHFNKIKQSLLSLPRAPFGGIESRRELSDVAIQFLLDCIHEYALACKMRFTSIKSPVNCYLPQEARDYEELYRANGFEISLDLANHVIPVSTIPFESTISNAELRRERKCKRSGFTVKQINQPSPDEIYDFLAKTRKSKGYPLTISPDTLSKLLARFPEEVVVFAVFNSSEIAALTVAIKVNKTVLYNFQPATSPDYEKFSPMVLLTEFLYTYCQHNKISFIDLGTSCDHHSIQKPGLVKFKENLGGIPFRKYTFTKHY